MKDEAFGNEFLHPSRADRKEIVLGSSWKQKSILVALSFDIDFMGIAHAAWVQLQSG
jgi:hypothetical protein